MRTILHWLNSNKAFVLTGFIFLLLLLRNPYSQRTLIANLEPYPDSIHYINPALNFISGKGLYIAREGRSFLPGVPLLYSFALMPGYLINADVRTFYFTNVLLAFVGLYLFYQILHKLFLQKNWLVSALLFLYVTNFVLYWYPELAMAENLTIVLFLGVINLFLLKPSRWVGVLIGILSIAFYATKFASLPLSVAVPIIYFVRLLFLKSAKDKRQNLLVFMFALIGVGLMYLGYEWFGRGNNLVGGLFSMFLSVFSPKQISQVAKAGSSAAGTGFFSLGYAPKNIAAYSHWLIGDVLVVLWKPVTILPKFLAITGMLGFLLALFTKRRFISLAVLFLLAANIAFMMTFYVADGRYFIIAVPSLILGFGLFFASLTDLLPKSKKILSVILLFVLMAIYLFSSISRLKFDVMLNLKYSESPWYYISVTTFDKYLAQHKSEFKQTPVIISALPPYYVDFFAKQKFELLPLSSNQEFQSRKIEAWGNLPFENLNQEYFRLYSAGHPVYLTGYGLGNEKYLHEAFDKLFTEFKFVKVADGCFSLCNVYQMAGKL